MTKGTETSREAPENGAERRIFWPAMVGYLAGLATAGVIALLMPTSPPEGSTYGAKASQPRQATAPPSPAPSATPARDLPQHAAAPLSPQARERIEPLRARLAADPADLKARKQLALALLQSQQLMAAYEHGTQILAAHPDDPDGLYVHGVVRIAMGHAPKAIELLDKVLARHPDHALALRARAEAQRKIGDEGGAALTEARARQAERGDQAEVDQLLNAASDGSLLEMMRSKNGRLPPGGAAIAAADGG